MDLELGGKVALVAGASRGLGRAVARSLAREGAQLAVCARSKEPLDRTTRELAREFGAEVLGRTADVTRESDVGALVDAAAERFGRIDILVANAGGPPSSRFVDTGVDAWRAGLDLNLLSTVLLCRAVVPGMRERRDGRLIAIASVSAKQPIDGLVVSNVSRLGVVGLFKSLASELAADNVRANVVCPGYTKTERLVELAGQIAEREKIPEGDVYGRWTGAIPMGRLGEPEELADLVAFLASERASYITGTCVQVDGGFVKGPI